MKDFGDDTGEILICSFFSPVLKVAGKRDVFKAAYGYLILE